MRAGRLAAEMCMLGSEGEGGEAKEGSCTTVEPPNTVNNFPDLQNNNLSSSISLDDTVCILLKCVNLSLKI